MLRGVERLAVRCLTGLGRRRTVWLGAMLAFGWLVTASAASALSMEFTLQSFTGDPSEVTILLDDAAAGAGNIQMTVTVSVGIGDLRGIFFDVVDDGVLAGLQITGDDVTSISLYDVINIGRGANLQGGGSPCPCDVGVEIGNPGMGKDDFQTTVIVIMHEALDLDLSMFSEQAFGVRLTSVGMDERRREGSSKLGGEAPFVVPEPSTAGLMGMGFAAFAFQRRRRA